MKTFEQKRRHAGQGGFTLIELLVVIAILGVLAGVVVFAVGGITNNSTEAACKIEARTLKTAVQAYRAENGAYPAATAAADENTWGNLVPEFLEEGSISYTYTGAAGSPPAPGYDTVAAADDGDCESFPI